MELSASNYIIALRRSVVPTNGSHGTVMFGGYSKLGKDDAANGPIASVCCVELWVGECDGFGTLKTMYGLRSTQKCKNDGFTLTLVKSLGITHGCMRKDGANQCHTALHFPLMVQRMSLDDMYERLSIRNLEPAVPRKFSFTSPTRFEVYDDPTCSRMRGSVWKKRMLKRIKNYVAMLSHLSLNLLSRTSDLERLLPLTILSQLHHPRRKIKNCLLSNLLVGQAVPRNGLMPEGRVDRAAKVDINQAIIQEILHSTAIESHDITSILRHILSSGTCYLAIHINRPIYLLSTLFSSSKANQ